MIVTGMAARVIDAPMTMEPQEPWWFTDAAGLAQKVAVTGVASASLSPIGKVAVTGPSLTTWIRPPLPTDTDGPMTRSSPMRVTDPT